MICICSAPLDPGGIPFLSAITQYCNDSTCCLGFRVGVVAFEKESPESTVKEAQVILVMFKLVIEARNTSKEC